MWWIGAAIQDGTFCTVGLWLNGYHHRAKTPVLQSAPPEGSYAGDDDGDLKSEQVATIAHTLDVPEQEVISISRRLTRSDHSLNEPLGVDDGGQWLDLLADESESHEDAIADREELIGRRSLSTQALRTSNERERDIIVERRLRETPVAFEELSRKYGISHQRVRQLSCGRCRNCAAS